MLIDSTRTSRIEEGACALGVRHRLGEKFRKILLNYRSFDLGYREIICAALGAP